MGIFHVVAFFFTHRTTQQKRYFINSYLFRLNWKHPLIYSIADIPFIFMLLLIYCFHLKSYRQQSILIETGPDSTVVNVPNVSIKILILLELPTLSDLILYAKKLIHFFKMVKPIFSQPFHILYSVNIPDRKYTLHKSVDK